MRIEPPRRQDAKREVSMPAKAGIHRDAARWTPASAGVEKTLGALAPWRFIIFVFLLLHFALPISARPLEQVKESGAIVLCAHPNALPFSAKDGARHGFQLELGAAIAHGMGVGFETHWTVSAHDLNRADCDFVLDAIADPEAQNESRLTLSKPYGASGVALAVRDDNRSIHAFVDLAAAGKIGILPGSMAAMYLGQHGVHTSPAGFESDLLDEVASGELVGAAVTPTAIGFYNTGHAAHPMKALALFAQVDDLNWNLAAGIAKPDAALATAIDAALDKLNAEGRIKAIYATYGVTLSPPR